MGEILTCAQLSARWPGNYEPTQTVTAGKYIHVCRSTSLPYDKNTRKLLKYDSQGTWTRNFLEVSIQHRFFIRLKIIKNQLLIKL